MNQVSIKIDENSKYTVELKEEYEAEEFISTIEGHLAKVRKLFSLEPNISQKDKTEKSGGHASFYPNDLFKKLNALIEGLGSDVSKKDKTTMRTFTSTQKSINKKRGLVWLKPVGNSLVIHLRSGDHSNVDIERKIVYSKPGKTTFGNYPTMKINKLDDIEYAYNIIKHIYEQ